ncbi:peptidoglycan-associated lipoprotein Pal [Sinimarinibacterium thermocellulolyticum]|uniref:Peptidoglycan-associated lipoprotein n=1 Tax=Sinimarinibacterium thermocellulolyticum TaxID=3170016 RepID=A0ABV2A6S9_9GAMM
MASKALVLSVFVLGAMLSGCASTRDRQDAAAASRDSGAYAPTPVAGGVRLSAGGDAAGLPAGVGDATIYFAYDSDMIDAAGQSKIVAWARYLSANPSVTVRLEGHADERGTSEYNQALGERRALAVRDALAAAGVSEAQMSTLSYGESRPAVSGHDERAYAQNRRVEIVR